MTPSHDVNKIRTRSYRFSGYQMKRIKTENGKYIIDALPVFPTTPYGNLTERAVYNTNPTRNT